MSKEKRVVIRVSPSTYDLLAKAAQASGLPVSTYVRSVAIVQAREDIASDARATAITQKIEEFADGNSDTIPE